jgi:hypothetical protein
MEELNKLASIHPYPKDEIEPIFINCRKIYFEKAFDKCNEILNFARSNNLSLIDSYHIQTEIDIRFKDDYKS